MGGFSFVWKLRHHPGLAGTRVVTLGSSTDVGPDHLSELGFAAQIRKPLLTTRLADGLAAAMRVAAQPRVEAPQPRATDTPAPALAGAGVLVATQNALDAGLIREVLAQIGCPTRLANDTRRASEQLKQGGVELVLLDCLLPDGGGLALASELRRPQSGHTPPIVGLRTDAVGVDRQSCLDAGMSDVLDKPFTPQRIREVAVRWLDRSRPPAAEPIPAPMDPGPPASAETSELEALPLLDSEVLATLAALAKPDKPDLLERILTAYRSDAAGNLEKLRAAVQRADSKRIYQAAHSLKSASSNVGAQRLAAAARTLELHSRQGRTEEAAPLLARLEREFQALSAELDARRLTPRTQRQG
jgi:CheY-like chemotaxis protein